MYTATWTMNHKGFSVPYKANKRPCKNISIYLFKCTMVPSTTPVLPVRSSVWFSSTRSFLNFCFERWTHVFSSFPIQFPNLVPTSHSSLVSSLFSRRCCSVFTVTPGNNFSCSFHRMNNSTTTTISNNAWLATGPNSTSMVGVGSMKFRWPTCNPI